MLIVLGLLNLGSLRRSVDEVQLNGHLPPRFSLETSPRDLSALSTLIAVLAVPITYSANRFQLFNRYVGAAAGAVSLAFGLFLAHQIGFVDGLFR